MPLLLIVYSSGFLVLNEEGALTADTAMLDNLSKSPDQLSRMLFMAYLRTERFEEAYYLRYYQRIRENYPFGIRCETRIQIAKAIKKCPPGRWIRFDEFERYMQLTNSDFLQARYSSYVHYYALHWEESERQDLHTILSFFGCLGAIDRCLPRQSLTHPTKRPSRKSENICSQTAGLWMSRIRWRSYEGKWRA